MSCSRAWSPSSRCATAQASRCSKPWLMRPNGLPPYNRRFDQHPQLFKRPLQRRPPYIKRHRRSMANHFDLEEQEQIEQLKHFWNTWGTLITDRKSTRLNSSHLVISYAVFCLKKKKKILSNSQLDQYHSTDDNFLIT